MLHGLRAKNRELLQCQQQWQLEQQQRLQRQRLGPRYRNGLLNVGSDRFKSKTIGVRDLG